MKVLIQKTGAILINKKASFFILILFFLCSCNDTSVFNQYKSVENNSWKANKKVLFEFDVNDSISPRNLFINIRNNNDYKYSNLYLITELSFPNGTVVIDTLQYEMTDKTGAFLGKGLTEVKDNKLFYKEKKTFPVSGKYMFNVRQAMRKNDEVNPIPFLNGITDVGFSIEKLD